MSTYTDTCRVLHALGYASFLPLQEKAFQMPQFHDQEKNIFLVGSTSSGKTLVPLIHYVLEKEQDPTYRMLFLVPYKALASQKMQEISETLHAVFPNLEVALSTGECREQDRAIEMGEVDVAVIIYEKAYHFSCRNADFLRHYQTIVYDEFALTEDASRGATCDLMLLHGQEAHCRLFVLATPHYSWGPYIHDSDFVLVRTEGADIGIPRTETPIFLDKTSAGSKKAEFHNFARQPVSVCGVRESGSRDDLIEDLCVWHLRMGHKILVFINDCQMVRQMARTLGERLRRDHPSLLNPVFTDAEGCFQNVLDETGLLDEDLEGLMDRQECLTYAQGIAYHNSWLGFELRSMIERELLTTEGRLKVVFCTETIAYGINSNVDVVIVADMHKSLQSRELHLEQEEGDRHPQVRGQPQVINRFLTVNEYQNYIGRAGRYGWSPRGYAYVLMTQRPNSRPIREQWQSLCRRRNDPPAAKSTLTDLDPFCNRKEGCPFQPANCKYCRLKANEFAAPVLSLIPESGITYRQLRQRLCHLPGLGTDPAWLDRNLNNALNCLMYWYPGLALIRCVRPEGAEEPMYCQNLAGKCLSGMMVTLFEARVMMRYLQGRVSYLPGNRTYSGQEMLTLLQRDPFDLFFQLSYLPRLQQIAFDFFGINDVNNESGIAKRNAYQELCTKQLRKYHRNAISNELYNYLIHHNPYGDAYNYTHRLPVLYRTMLSILIYEWYKTASIGKMQDELSAGSHWVYITPGRISRLSQQVSFYLQMTSALCKMLSGSAYSQIDEMLKNIESCLYFGIREDNARVLDVSLLRRLTRQQQMKVAQIMEFCSNHPDIPAPDELTHRQRSNWHQITAKFHSLENETEIADQLIQAYPVLDQAEQLFTNRKG